MTENATAAITSFSEHKNQYTIVGKYTKKTLVVLRQSYYPEWSATIDGKKVEISKVNLIQMGVFMPPGNHTLVVSYQNNGFIVGFMLTAAYTAIFLLLIRYLKFI
jgi:uncharacterized membrane protein YfhO